MRGPSGSAEFIGIYRPFALELGDEISIEGDLKTQNYISKPMGQVETLPSVKSTSCGLYENCGVPTITLVAVTLRSLVPKRGYH